MTSQFTSLLIAPPSDILELSPSSRFARILVRFEQDIDVVGSLYPKHASTHELLTRPITNYVLSLMSGGPASALCANSLHANICQQILHLSDNSLCMSVRRQRLQKCAVSHQISETIDRLEIGRTQRLYHHCYPTIQIAIDYHVRSLICLTMTSARHSCNHVLLNCRQILCFGLLSEIDVPSHLQIHPEVSRVAEKPRQP